MRAVDTAEAEKRSKEEARNVLESYVYKLRDLLEQEADSDFFEFSSKEERVKLGKLVDETNEWLATVNDETHATELHAKRRALE